MQNTFGPHLQNLMITSQNSSSAVPRSITGCFVTQNIGEVARSDGGVEKTDNSSDKVKPPLSAVSRSITGCFRKEIYFVPLFFNDKLYFLCP